jgi:c-di-GMP-binding flagellar brake protein YcgR
LPRRAPTARTQERRSDARVSADHPASLKLVNTTSAVRTDVRVVDVSKGGVKLRVAEALKPGTVIQVRLKGANAVAKVVYCRKAGTVFHVGVQFQDIFSKRDGGW